jgi:murein DD-endopeptidase MepM/ murein hydrolase activator NlpD
MRPPAFLLTLLVWPVALPAQAGMPTDLALPIDCEPGKSCWIVQYVDHDPGPGARDYMCGSVTTDGQKGTDIAIRDLAVMARGVEVRAAAAGVVDALRDGVPDVSVEQGGRAAVAGKECGNAIRIAHGDGWTTWYCHLRRGSLLVKEGDKVAVGQPLALVGLSGDTSFPHVHFDVRHGDDIIDPFVGPEPDGDCGPGKAPLWRADVMAQLAYQPVVLTNAGFAPNAPEMADVVRGWHQQTTLPTTAPALVLWAEGYWVETGDHVRFTISGPDGSSVLDRAVDLGKGWKRWFQFAGARRPGDAWPAGTYTGTVALERAKVPPVTLRRSLEIR